MPRFRNNNPDQNPWGNHDDHGFQPYNDYIVRCIHCKELIDHTHLDHPAQCSICNGKFTNSQCRDMFLESQQVHLVHGGWSKELLDRVRDRKIVKGSVTFGKDGGLREVGDRAARAGEMAVKQQRLQAQMREFMRKQSKTSRALQSDVTGRKVA